MALKDLQARLQQARGGRPRREIVEQALAVPGAPDFLSEQRLRALETMLQTPPQDGEELRAYVAALGLNVFEVLRDLGYWPPFPSPRGQQVPDLLLEEAVRLGGWRVASAGGGKIVIEKS